MGTGISQTADTIKDEALWFAAAHGDVESVAHYMAKAADVNHRNKEEGNTTPLMLASQEGHTDIVALLLSSPYCDVHIRDEWGFTACHHAARWGHDICVRQLLAAAADITATCSNGSLPAHCAAECGHAACLAVLLAAGCDAEARTKEGHTVYALSSDQATRDVLEASIARRAAEPEGQSPGRHDGKKAPTERAPLLEDALI